jgi:hypothetical protein
MTYKPRIMMMIMIMMIIITIIGSLAVPVLRYIALKLLTRIKKKYKNWIEKQEKC